MKRILGLVLLLSAGLGLSGAEKELMRIDFKSPDWQEFASELWGKTQVRGDALEMGPGSRLSSAMLPVHEGETIRVDFDAACDGLVGDDFRVGWCTVGYFDAAKQPIGHADTLQIRGDTPWREVSVPVAPPGRCAWFTVNFSHSGSAGVARYRNIRIYANDRVADELIGDSDFEDLLGVNYWFFRRSGSDWDGLAYWSDAATAAQDTAIRASGDKSLLLSGGVATLVSNEFPYHGETLILSGWMRTEGLKMGRTGWAGGGVQLVGLDENGVPVAHEDLYIRLDDKPWQYYDRTISFASAVKKVQVFLRLFDGASGKFRVDGLRLRSIPAGAVLPFEPAANTLTIDAGAPASDAINYRVWAGVDALYAGWLLRPDVQQCLPYLKAAGIEMIRFREICNMLNMYPGEDAAGKPVYDFTRFDNLFDLLVREGFVPNITIGTTPPALARPGTMVSGWCNPTAPADFAKWGAFVEAMFRHAIDRYGVAEVNRWYWEIWNEPVLPATHGDYVGSVEDFVALAVEVYLAKERVDAACGTDLKLGMTSGGQSGASDEYIFARLAEMGKLNLVKHRSRHYYAGISNAIRSIPAMIADSRDLGKQFPGAPGYEVGCTEWNCTAMSSPYSDTPWNAAMAVKMARLFLDAGLDYGTFFAMVGHPEIPQGDALFLPSGDLAMITRTNDYRDGGYGTLLPVPKPVYNAFYLLNDLKGGHRLPVERSAEPVDAIAVKMPDGAIRIVLTNYDEDVARQPYTTRTTLRIAGVPGTRYRVTRLAACDDEYGNSYGAWKKLGCPGIGDRKALEAIVAAAVPVELPLPEAKYEDGDTVVTLDIPSPGIRLLELAAE